MDHPTVAGMYGNIGSAYLGKQDLNMAHEYFGKELGIEEKRHGAGSNRVAAVNAGIGKMMMDKSYFSGAIPYMEKAVAVFDKTNVAFSEMIMQMLYVCNFNSVGNGERNVAEFEDFMADKAFVVSVVDGGPASEKGLSGDYYLLEMGDWNCAKALTMNMNDEISRLTGKAKDIVIMKDGIVSRHHFDDKMGVQYILRKVPAEAKAEVEAAYAGWKANGAEL